MAGKKLTDVLDINFLQKFQDAFSGATGMASISTDLDGSVTSPSNFTEFCIDITRNSKEGLSRCVECDLRGGEESLKTGRPSVYFCHAGLMDFAAPIIVDGEQIGSIIGGQVLTKAPDEKKFRRIAEEIGVDPDKYINALRKVKVVPENQVRQAADLLYLSISQLVKVQTQIHKLEESNSIIKENVEYINEQINIYSESTKEIVQDQIILSEKLNALSTVIDNINMILVSIRKISQKTQIISINASIESARSGLAGRSFTVIAQEIRSLADETAKTIGRIEGYTSEILSAISELTEISLKTSESLDKQTNNIATIFPRLDNIINTMQDLNNI